MRPSLAVKLLAPLVAAWALTAVCLAQEPEFGGSVEQSAGVALPLYGSFAPTFGSATSIDGTFALARDSISVKLSGRLSILYGSKASNARAALALDPDSRIGVLTSPGYDPDTYNPAVPDGSWFASLSLKEAVLSFSVRNLALEAGKTIVNWGVGTAFSPADFFSDIDYSGGSPSRQSSLIGRLSWFPSPVSRLDIAAEPFSAKGATYAARGYSIAGDRLAFAVEAGYRRGISPAPDLALAALELSLDLPFVSPYGEISTGISLDGSGEISIKAMAGAQTRIGDLSLLAEYGYDDSSSSTHRAFLRAALPLGDWVTIAAPFIIDFSAGSFTSGLVVAVPDLEGIALSLSASASLSAMGTWSTTADLSARAAF
jgi:hypothetical protein